MKPYIYQLPLELVHWILEEVVLERPLKRALRLRLVCKLFEKTIPIAIVHRQRKSLECAWWYSHESTRFFQKYITYSVLEASRTKSIHPIFDDLLRHIARTILVYRGFNLDVTGTSTYEDLIAELSVLPLLRRSRFPSVFRAYSNKPTRYRGKDRDFLINLAIFDRHCQPGPSGEWKKLEQEATLSAAAYLGENGLVKKFIESGHNFMSADIPSQKSWFQPPLALAAYTGNTDLLQYLLAQPRLPWETYYRRISDSIDHALEGSRLTSIPLIIQYEASVLTEAERPVRNGLEIILEQSDQVERLDLSHWFAAQEEAILTLNYLRRKRGRNTLFRYPWGGVGTLADRLLFETNHDKEPNQTLYPDEYATVLGVVARYGYDDILQVLLARGIDYDPAFVEACKGGHKSTMTLLLDTGAISAVSIQAGFKAAVTREHTHLLQKSSEWPLIEVETKVDALKKAKELELHSMFRLVIIGFCDGTVHAISDVTGVSKKELNWEGDLDAYYDAFPLPDSAPKQ